MFRLSQEQYNNLSSLLESPKLTEKDKDGCLLEYATDQALTILEIKHKSNPFDPSGWKDAREGGADHKATHRKKRYIIEDKNLNGRYFFNPKKFKDEVLNRYEKDDPQHKTQWIWAVSIARVGRRVLALCREFNIKIVQVGFKVSLQNIEKAIQTLIKKLSILFKIRGVSSLSRLYHMFNCVFIWTIDALKRIKGEFRAKGPPIINPISQKTVKTRFYSNQGWKKENFERFWVSERRVFA